MGGSGTAVEEQSDFPEGAATQCSEDLAGAWLAVQFVPFSEVSFVSA